MEVFRDLDSYYAVSNLGRVKSLRRNKVLKSHIDSKHKGYAYITLNYDGVKRSRQVHRLVAEAFIPNPNNYPCINHKDENPRNNSVDNLEWCSYSYNLSYGTKICREHATKIKNNICNAPKAVAQLDLNGNILNTFPSASDTGKILNIASTHIINCCNSKVSIKNGYKWVTRTAGGFKFMWLSNLSTGV